MLAIMTSVYDMMGRYTLPSVREDSPYEHVEKFFQVHHVQQPRHLHPFINRTEKCKTSSCLKIEHVSGFLLLFFFFFFYSPRKWTATETAWWPSTSLSKPAKRWITARLADADLLPRPLHPSHVCVLSRTGWKYNGLHAALWERHLIAAGAELVTTALCFQLQVFCPETAAQNIHLKGGTGGGTLDLNNTFIAFSCKPTHAYFLVIPVKIFHRLTWRRDDASSFRTWWRRFFAADSPEEHVCLSIILKHVMWKTNKRSIVWFATVW